MKILSISRALPAPLIQKPLPILLFALLLNSSPLGALEARVCDSNIKPFTPSSDFTINGDGTVTHLKTGLTWLQCSLGQTWNEGECKGVASIHSWQEAISISEELNFAGFNDWRLPNVKELSSIVEYHCSSPAINLTVFPSTPNSSNLSRFWSSSPYINARYGKAGNSALSLHFYRGSIVEKAKYEAFAVRAVRSSSD